MSEMFTFKHPWVLLNLLWVPLWFIFVLKRHRVDEALVFTSSRLVFKKNRPGSDPLWMPLLLRVLGVACLIMALARPCKVVQHSNVKSSGVDMLLALDLSSSMLVRDFSLNQFERTSRMEAAKYVLANFIKKRQQDRIGLVAFARYPYLVSPLTLNHAWLLKNLDRLQAGLIEDGTAIGSAVTTCVNRLKDLDGQSRVIVLLTDGVNNYGAVAPLMAAEVAENFQTKIYTVMAGNDQFFPVDEETLKQMAEKTGGRFYRAYDLSTLKGIYDEIDRLEKRSVDLEGNLSYEEFFAVLLIFALILFLLERFLAQTIFRVLP